MGCSSPLVHMGCSEPAGSCLDKVSDICKQWVSAGPGPGYLEQGSQLSLPKCLNGGPRRYPSLQHEFFPQPQPTLHNSGCAGQTGRQKPSLC